MRLGISEQIRYNAPALCIGTYEMITLGIETSCDETAAAVVDDHGLVYANCIASQIHLFEQVGGVVPELAARAHTEKIIPVIDQALIDSGLGWDQIDQIAVTEAPGLIGSLLVGQSASRALAYARHKSLVWVNHLRAHVLAAWLQNKDIEFKSKNLEIAFPAIGLLVSGGHTELISMQNMQTWEVIGRTRDDAAGEAFDKVGTLLGLPYPGGPQVSRAAATGDPAAFAFPRALLETGSCDFSFSGLKTAVLRSVQQEKQAPRYASRTQFVADVAASFEQAVVDTLLEKTRRACSQHPAKSIILAGGVAANQALRAALSEEYKERLHLPALEYCTDNAAMVAFASMQN